MIVFYPVCLLRFNPLFSIFLLVLFIQCCNAGVVEYRWNMLVFYSASSVAVQNMLLLQAAGGRQAERLSHATAQTVRPIMCARRHRRIIEYLPNTGWKTPSTIYTKYPASARVVLERRNSQPSSSLCAVGSTTHSSVPRV